MSEKYTGDLAAQIRVATDAGDVEKVLALKARASVQPAIRQREIVEVRTKALASLITEHRELRAPGLAAEAALAEGRARKKLIDAEVDALTAAVQQEFCKNMTLVGAIQAATEQLEQAKAELAHLLTGEATMVDWTHRPSAFTPRPLAQRS